MYIWQQSISLKIKRLFEINVIWDNEYRISRTSEVVTIVVQSNHADNYNHQNRVCISQTDTRLIFYGQWKDGETNLPGFIAMNIKPFYAGPRTIILSNKRNYAWSKSEYLWNQRRYLYKIFWKSFSHRCKWFRIIFMSVLENDHGHCTLFVISKFILPPHETSWSGSFCFEGGSLYFETTENAASVRWPRSSGRWDFRAWRFAQHSCSLFQFSQGYWPEPAGALSHVFYCMCLSTFSP